MKLSVSFTLVGTYYVLADPSQVLPMQVRFEVSPPNLGDLWRGDVPAVGLVRADKLASGQKLDGKISVRPEERTTRYAFRFATDEGRTLRFWGAQDFLLADAWGSLVRLEGTAYDNADNEVLRATLRFKARKLRAALR